jgi:hypothetical protein
LLTGDGTVAASLGTCAWGGLLGEVQAETAVSMTARRAQGRIFGEKVDMRYLLVFVGNSATMIPTPTGWD